MKSLWEEATRRQTIERIEQLKPDAKALWGTMTAPQMLAHLADSMRMASGELKPAPKKLPIRHPPLKQMIVYWLPIPRNSPTASELISRTPGSWEEEATELMHRVQEFGRRETGGNWPEHPAFGKLSPTAWGVLAYRHIDHHLRQFGT